MRMPSLLWPFPWWTNAIAIVLLLLIPYVIALARVRVQNNRLRTLGAQLRDSGMTTGTGLFAIGEDKNVLLVSGQHLAVADLKNYRPVQMLDWSQVRVLKIYDNRSNLIQFRLVSGEGAQSRKIVTHSIAGFGRLFIEAAKPGKSVEYIQS
jgi:hypothetical protein